MKQKLAMLRGGAWNYGSPRFRSAYRGVDLPTLTRNFVGFRILLRSRRKQ